MKKLLSLLAILGLAGFVVAPIYAQENDDLILGDEVVAIEAEDIEAADEDVAAYDDVEAIDADLEAIDEPAIEGSIEVEGSDDLSAILEGEDFQAALDETGLTKEEAVWILGVLAGLWIAAWIVGLVWIILVIVAMWKIFEKAGEAGWKSIIPIYNVYIMYKIVGMKNWFWYSILIPFCLGFIAGLLWEESAVAGYLMIASYLFSGIISIVAAFKLPRKFGWGVFASILYVLFTGICVLVLGFGNYKYEGKEEKTVVEA